MAFLNNPPRCYINDINSKYQLEKDQIIKKTKKIKDIPFDVIILICKKCGGNVKHFTDCDIYDFYFEGEDEEEEKESFKLNNVKKKNSIGIIYYNQKFENTYIKIKNIDIECNKRCKCNIFF